MKFFIRLSFYLLFITLTAGKSPYVILVSFDAFRWDYPLRNITPTFAEVENKGVKALSLQPCFPSKTFPNHYSIITGMYPENHGIISNSFRNPVSGEYYSISNKKAVRNCDWYKGVAFWETAKKNNIKTASFFWPGSEVDNETRRPDLFKYYDKSVTYKERIDTVIKWLKLPADERPKFTTLYFRETDDKGHYFGPDSPGINSAIVQIDTLLNYLLKGIKTTEIADSINLILVSDHGMTEVSEERTIKVWDLLGDAKVEVTGDGPFMMITPDDNEVDNVFDKLKSGEKHFKTYKKDEVPEYFHFSKSNLISPIVLIADLGWSLLNDKEQDYSNPIKGNHGYDNYQLDMHGIFYAYGPAFKQNYETGTLLNIDIYPLLCRMYEIEPGNNIDGKIERIEFILN